MVQILATMKKGLVTKRGILATLPFGGKFVRPSPPKEWLEKTRKGFEEALAAAKWGQGNSFLLPAHSIHRRGAEFMYLPKFEYFEPKTVPEACSLVSKYGEKAKVLAGGTDLIGQLKERTTQCHYLINLKFIPELKEIKKNGNGKVQLGSLVTHTAIIQSSIIREEFDVLTDTARSMGNWQTQNLGTIGGNLCNASPSADLPPVLMALGANVWLGVPVEKEK